MENYNLTTNYNDDVERKREGKGRGGKCCGKNLHN